LDGIRNAIQNGCVGDGTTNDRAALNTLANTTMQSGGGIIYFPTGYTFRVSSALTFPSNVTLWFAQGAKITVDTGVTVTVQGPVDAVPGVIVFTGIGTVSCTAAFPAATSLAWWDAGVGTLGFTSNYYGTYTPTVFNTTNVAGSAAYVASWTRTGNVISVGWRADIDPTLAAPTLTQLGISLPVASNFTTGLDVWGAAAFSDISGQSGLFYSDSANDRAVFRYTASNAANATASGTFSYLVK
jgi:Pectate lyase superfamily protein